jgi:hypothetical protein
MVIVNKKNTVIIKLNLKNLIVLKLNSNNFRKNIIRKVFSRITIILWRLKEFIKKIFGANKYKINLTIKLVSDEI